MELIKKGLIKINSESIYNDIKINNKFISFNKCKNITIIITQRYDDIFLKDCENIYIENINSYRLNLENSIIIINDKKNFNVEMVCIKNALIFLNLMELNVLI